MTGEDFEAHLLMVGFVPHGSKREARCYHGIDLRGFSAWVPMTEQVFVHIDQHTTATVRWISPNERPDAIQVAHSSNQAHFNGLPDDLKIHPDIARVLKHCS
jgi:hypothetical protein